MPLLYAAGCSVRVPVWLSGVDAAGTGGAGSGAGNTGGIVSPWDVIPGLVLFVAMIVGALLLLRLFSRGGLGRQSRYMRVLDRYPVSRDCQLLVLNAGGRILVVCVGRDGGNLLCELDPAALDMKTAESAAPSGKDGASERSTFGERFWHNFRLNMGRMPKGTKPMGPPPKGQPRFDPADPEAFAAILDAVQQRVDKEAAETAGGYAGEPAALPRRSAGDADYQAAVENMRRLAQTDRAAPAARPGSSPAPASPGRAGNTDEDTARELLRVLKERGGRHESANPAYTKPAYTNPAYPKSTGRQPSGDSRDGAIDGILDSIAKRQSRYTSGQSGPGQGKGKDHL